GGGLSWGDQALIADQIGYIDPSIATAAGLMAVETGWGFTLNRHCSEEVREKFVQPAIEGDQFVGIATTEPGGGSDVAGFTSTAERDGDDWILNGEKTFISGTEEAKEMGGGYWVNVRTGPKPKDAPHKNMTSFFVPIDADGVQVQEPYRDAGRMAISTGGFIMEDVRIPDRYRLGEEGKGFYYTMEGFDNARILIGASSVGVTRRILEEAADYIKERETFGKPLAKYEGIQFEFADLYTRMKALRLMYQKVAQMQETRYQEAGKGERKAKPSTYSPTDVARWISMIKWKAPHLAKEAADKAMHWLGAAGYSDEYVFETAWKGVMSYCVGAEGGANIQKIVIARETLGSEYVPYD
ncbi:MAG: acyl-CoA dehydrogenase family protein, partial [Candidatus Bipolaricaulota bacterium]